MHLLCNWDADWVGCFDIRKFTPGPVYFHRHLTYFGSAKGRQGSQNILLKLSINPCLLQVMEWFGFDDSVVNLVFMSLVPLYSMLKIAPWKSPDNLREQAKHIEIDYHFIRQLVLSGMIYLQHCTLSKPASRSLHESCAPSSAWFPYLQVEVSSKSTLIWVGSVEVWWVAHQNTHSPHDQPNWQYQVECISLHVGSESNMI